MEKLWSMGRNGTSFGKNKIGPWALFLLARWKPSITHFKKKMNPNLTTSLHPNKYVQKEKIEIAYSDYLTEQGSDMPCHFLNITHYQSGGRLVSEFLIDANKTEEFYESIRCIKHGKQFILHTTLEDTTNNEISHYVISGYSVEEEDYVIDIQILCTGEPIYGIGFGFHKGKSYHKHIVKEFKNIYNMMKEKEEEFKCFG